MFGLLCGLWHSYFKKQTYQVLTIGLDNAGKTTLLEQIRHLHTQTPEPAKMQILPTVGLNICRIEADQHHEIVFWDLGGQDSLRVLWDKYFSESHAIVFVVDSTDRDRMPVVRNEIHKVLTDKDLRDAPFVLAVNKKDMANALSSEEVVELLQLHVTDRLFGVYSISAMTGENVQKIVSWLLGAIINSKRTQRIEIE